MVTKDDVCGVTIFAGLDPADCERLARAASDISLVTDEYAASEGAERALFAVLEGKIEAVKLVDGVERVVGERERGGHLRRGADRARHGLPRRLPRRRAVARDARRAAGLPRRRVGGAGRRQGGRAARRAPDDGRAWAPGARVRVLAVARDRGGQSPRRRMFRPSPVPRPQPDLVHVDPAGRQTRKSSGAARSPRRTTARWFGSWTARPSSVRSCVESPSCSASAPSRSPPSTTPSSSVRGRPVSPPRCTALPRVSGRSSSSGRRRAARRARRHGSRTTSGFTRACPATSSRAARCARRAGSVRRSS